MKIIDKIIEAYATENGIIQPYQFPTWWSICLFIIAVILFFSGMRFCFHETGIIEVEKETNG